MIDPLDLGQIMTQRFGARWIPHRKEWAWKHGDRVIRLDYDVSKSDRQECHITRLSLEELDLDMEPRGGGVWRKGLGAFKGEMTRDAVAKWIAIQLISTD